MYLNCQKDLKNGLGSDAMAGYMIKSLSSELKRNYPVFKQSIEAIYLYYSLHENMLSILSGYRDYDISHSIMKALLEIFHIEYAKMPSKHKVLANNVNIIYNESLLVSENLIKQLKDTFPSSDFKDLKYIPYLSLADKLNCYKLIINKVMKTPSKPSILNYAQGSDYQFTFAKTGKLISLFFHFIILYEKIFCNNNNINSKPVNNKDVFITEFFMFLSHFTFAYTTDFTSQEDDSRAKHFIANNLAQAEKHLEKGILNIAKVVSSSIVASNSMDNDLVIQLAAIRQKEYFSLSQNLESRVTSYILWLSYVEILSGSTEIVELLNKIQSMLASK